MATVFLAAFVAGGTAAVAVNRFVDVARTQARPTVECEPIFVALRSLPAGSPVTVWDVKLHEWPKAMVPASAMRPDESGRWCNEEERLVARVAIREGQPVLKHQLDGVPIDATASNTPAPVVPVVASPEVTPAASTDGVVAPSAILAEADATATPVAVVEADVPEEAVPQTTPIASQEAAVETVAQNPVPVADVATAAEATPATGEGWPTAAEVSTGGETAMRFLVVPERIAILADELTSPTPVKKDVADPVQQAADTRKPSPRTLTGQTPRTTPPSPAMRQRSTPPTKSVQANQANPTVPTAEPVRRTAKPQPPTANRVPPARSATVAPPKVRVEPEAEVPEEDGSVLKSVFPNMAAGLEKLESEMVRIRRERFGALFGTDAGTPDSPDTNRRPR